MIGRRQLSDVQESLTETPAVVLLGPRQVGKTTLALEIANSRPSVYLDLEAASDLAKLADPELYLSDHADQLVVLDEIHRAPRLFQTLRGLIDQGRRRGTGAGRFLLLGSASMALLQQSGESLAGRVTYVELHPFDLTETASTDPDAVWVRGGFPEALLRSRVKQSFRWRQDFLRTYLERDIPELGPRIPAETLRRLWTMLAHQQGCLLNNSTLARSLGVSSPTVASYLGLLVDLLLVRRLPAWHANVGKRLVKSPKVYVRDSGLLHTLLGLPDKEAVLSHPIAGPSWEGHIVENVIRILAPEVRAEHYRTSGGAELDLVLTWPSGQTIGVEVKRSLAPQLSRGAHVAMADLGLDHLYIAYPGDARYRLAERIEVVGPTELCREIAELS